MVRLKQNSFLKATYLLNLIVIIISGVISTSNCTISTKLKVVICLKCKWHLICPLIHSVCLQHMRLTRTKTKPKTISSQFSSKAMLYQEWHLYHVCTCWYSFCNLKKTDWHYWNIFGWMRGAVTTEIRFLFPYRTSEDADIARHYFEVHHDESPIDRIADTMKNMLFQKVLPGNIVINITKNFTESANTASTISSLYHFLFYFFIDNIAKHVLKPIFQR